MRSFYRASPYHYTLAFHSSSGRQLNRFPLGDIQLVQYIALENHFVDEYYSIFNFIIGYIKF
jgi:hypothetical protein